MVHVTMWGKEGADKKFPVPAERQRGYGNRKTEEDKFYEKNK